MKNPLRTEWERIVRDGEAVGKFNALLAEAMKVNDTEVALYILETRVPKLESHLGRFFARINGSYPRIDRLRRHLLMYHLPRKPT